MSGHSKWSTIKHKKGAADAKRGRIFTRLIKEITVAARMGGGDSVSNPRLRAAIQEAKSENMSKDKIERAIKKGTGELESIQYEEVIYEGYGPGGAAVLIESVTDNKNRAVADIRHILSKAGGNLGAAGCVAWMFEKKGYIVVEGVKINEESLMEVAIDSGAEDVREDDGNYEIITDPTDFEQVKKAIGGHSIPCLTAEITMLPRSTLRIEGKEAEQMIKLMETFEECEDVQKVYTNADIPQEVVDSIG